jgi:DNA primase
MLPVEDNFFFPTRYHEALPRRIRKYLNERGISDRIIYDNLIGWNGWRITIPIMNQERRFGFFKLAKDPEDRSDSPKMLCTPGGTAELYGWETVSARPKQLIICEGEFDRLVLESRGFSAVTSTGGAGSFKPEWAEALAGIPEVYICFDRDKAGEDGVLHVASLLPTARIIVLSDEVGPRGDVTDYFVRLGKTLDDFKDLMKCAKPLSSATGQTLPEPVRSMMVRAHCELEGLKRRVPIEFWIGRTMPLSRCGNLLRGRCPFHEDRNPSFIVYPENQNYYCFGCKATGDVLDYIARSERLTFGQALIRLRAITKDHG